MNLRDVQKKLIDYSRISGTNIKLYDENNIEVFDTSKGYNLQSKKRNPIFKVIPTSLGGLVVEVNYPKLVSIQAISATDSKEDQLLVDPPISNIVNQVVKSIAIIGILSIITSIGLIWIISRKTLNPISNIVNISKDLSKGDFTQRIDQSVSGELNEIVTAFNYMASELQKLDEQRKIMMEDIAHELRTPMTNLKGYIEGWSDGIIKPDNETLKILDYQVNTLSKIIDDLSTLSLAESGMLNLNISEFDLSHKISEIIEEKIQKEIPEITHATIHLEPFITVPKNFNIEDTVTEEKIKKIVENYPEVKKVGRILSLKFENILKIDIDCSFDKELSIENVHDLTSEIEHVIRLEINNSVITIHPEPN